MRSATAAVNARAMKTVRKEVKVDAFSKKHVAKVKTKPQIGTVRLRLRRIVPTDEAPPPGSLRFADIVQLLRRVLSGKRVLGLAHGA